MGLDIKNEETVRLVREPADALDVSMTAAITDAVAVRLAKLHRHPQPAFDVDLVLAEWAETGERMGVEYRDQGFDAVLYDERGLPK
ncbi:MAG: type II toxin-antitoxin system VapB family antitoxin [Chloroflexota bacterium]